jgi:hypothetical protein
MLFIKGCLTEAILIPHMNHAAKASLDTKRIITCYPPNAGDVVLDRAKGDYPQAKSILRTEI